ncbi:MAG: peptidylprolyl isomerase, partial [Pseudomonadota bacterium]
MFHARAASLDHAMKSLDCASAVPLPGISVGVGVALGLVLAGCQAGHEKQAPLGPPEPARALAGLRLERPISARLETSEGTIHCGLDAARAPRSVALFVGLAVGRARFRDLRSGAIVTRPFYRDQTFFRAIPDLLVQSGCPLGNGTGTPGYRIALEPSASDAQRLAEPGALFLASYHPAPNRTDPAPPPPGQVIGSQFVVSLGNMSHLAGQVNVLGVCTDLERVRAIARIVAAGAHPVRLIRITVEGVSEAD